MSDSVNVQIPGKETKVGRFNLQHDRGVDHI